MVDLNNPHPMPNTDRKTAEEKTVYFIERKSDGKWLSGTMKGVLIYTRDPHKALQFDNRKEPEGLCEEDDFVSEHIFVESTQTFI